MHLANLFFLCLTLGVMRSQAVEYITFTLNVGVEASDLPEVDDGKGGQKPGDHVVSIYMQKGFSKYEGIGTTETLPGNAPVWKQEVTIKHVKDSDERLKFKLFKVADKDELMAEQTLTLKFLCDRNWNRVSDRYSVKQLNLSPDSKGYLYIRSRIAAEDLNGKPRNATTNRRNSVLPYNILVVLALGYFLQHSISTAPNL